MMYMNNNSQTKKSAINHKMANDLWQETSRNDLKHDELTEVN